jgi:hypothetical protein
MSYIWAAIWWVLSLVWSILMWIVGVLFWLFFWFLLPFAILAFIALRVAEHVLGQDKVRAWVKAQSAKYGLAASTKARRAVFALGVLPFRVIAWFAVYAVWHALVSILWRPRWSPWQRAWSKRWRPAQARSYH